MRRTGLAACLVLLAGATVGLGEDPGERPGAVGLTQRADALLAEWDAPGSPGGAVVLTRSGEVILMRSYGLADIEHGIPIDPATRFELASVSKMFTAFGVLLLEQAGKLSLGHDIHQYFPELPDRGSRITVADLVHHTSGISDWVRVLPYTGQYSRFAGFGIEDLLGLVARQRVLEFEAGTKWSYSNTNYALLAEIVARVTGRPFGEWMREHVFEPLEMHNTSFPEHGARLLPGRANSYLRDSDGRVMRSLVEAFEIPGPAHAFSTIDDMAKWLDNLRTGRLGGPDIKSKMQAGTTLATGEQSFYGAGMGMGQYRGVRTAGHSGQTGGFKTELIYCPEIEVGVVVLGNAGWMQADDIARRVLDLYLEEELRPLAEASAGSAEEPAGTSLIELEPEEYERLLGGYRLDGDPSVLVAVAREGDWLVGAIVGKGIDLFRPVAPSEFVNRHQNCTLAFVHEKDEQRTVSRVLITLRGEEMWATRVYSPRDLPSVDNYLGFYYSDELETAYEIVRGTDGLAVRVPHSETRPLYPVETDMLAGGIGILTLVRGEKSQIIGFDFSEPEDLGQRQIRFVRRGECE